MAHMLSEQGLDFVKRAPVAVRAELVLPGTNPEAVWPSLADATAWVDWFDGVTEACYTSPGPPGVGSTRRVRLSMLRVSEEVLAFEPRKRFAFRVTEANLPALRAMVEDITLDRAGDSTWVVYRQGVEMEPWARPLAPLVRRQLRRGLRRSLARLDRRVAERSGIGGIPN
jgi:hypothetical protein